MTPLAVKHLNNRLCMLSFTDFTFVSEKSKLFCFVLGSSTMCTFNNNGLVSKYCGAYLGPGMADIHQPVCGKNLPRNAALSMYAVIFSNFKSLNLLSIQFVD